MTCVNKPKFFKILGKFVIFKTKYLTLRRSFAHVVTTLTYCDDYPRDRLGVLNITVEETWKYLCIDASNLKFPFPICNIEASQVKEGALSLAVTRATSPTFEFSP